MFSFFLIPYLIKAMEIQPVIVGQGDLTDLKTSIFEYSYFYMEVHPQKFGDLYFFLKDSKYFLTEVKYYVAMSKPNEELIGNVSDQFRNISRYNFKENKDDTEYYYKYTFGGETWGKEKFLLIKYIGRESTGKLQVRSSFDDLYKLNYSKLSSLHIILIAAGCIIFIGILATVLVIVCKKKKKTKEKMGTIDPSPLVRESTSSAILKNVS